MWRQLGWLFAGAVLSFLTLPTLAQKQSYRVELSSAPEDAKINATLFNDGEKAIEAFRFQGTCGGAGVGRDYDVLDNPGAVRRAPAASHAGRIMAGVIAPGSSVVADRMLPQPSGCAWEAAVNAVLYEDGSFEGDQSGVRELVARREGMSASLTAWLDVLNGTSSPGDLAMVADRAADEDQKKAFVGYPKSPVVYGYWMGREHVDRNLAVQARPRQTDDPEVRRKALIEFLDRWEKRIASDAGFKNLQYMFPLPAGIEPGRVVQTEPGPK